MEKKIEVPQDVVNKLQALSLETEARKELIAFMLGSEMATETEQFKKYNEEYKDFYFQYTQAKQEFEDTYVRAAVANPIKWALDFNRATATITY